MREPVDDQPNYNSDACGGARAPSETVIASSPPCSRRGARMRSISSGSSILAITFSRPPQRAHCSISIPHNAEAQRRGTLQARVLDEATADADTLQQVDLARAGTL